MKSLPIQAWGEASDYQPIYFAHANGFPPETYQPIIEALAGHRQVVSYPQRPLWNPKPNPNDLKTWQQLADDVIQFFEQNNMKNVVAVGHSLGSVTAFLAAQKRPDLIKAMVMIEPVTLPWFYCWMVKYFPWLVIRRVKIVDKALNRPNEFESLQAAFDFHRKPRVFKRVSDENLMHYIRAAVSQDRDGVYRLVYPREWEAQIYGTVTYFRNQLLKSKLPILAMRGAHSDTISAEFWSSWQNNINHQCIGFPDNGHLLPLENPGAVVKTMMPFIQKHLS